MLATVAAADSASTVRKKYSIFIYSEGEPHAMYAIYKQTLTLCVLQYLLIEIRHNFVLAKLAFSSIRFNPFMPVVPKTTWKVSQVQTTTVKEISKH